MANERLKLRMVRANSDLYVMVRVTAEGLEIEDPVQMNEKEFRASFKMNRSRTDKEIDDKIAKARAEFIP